MTPDAWLVAQTEVNWTRYLQEASNILARSLTTPIDKMGIQAIGLGAFLSTIAEARKKGSDPIKAIRYDWDVQRHVSFSFLVSLESTNELYALTDLSITGPIISGSLDKWIRSVVRCTAKDVSFETRLLFDKIYLLFDTRCGLSECWASWEKITNKDGTFSFEPK